MLTECLYCQKKLIIQYPSTNHFYCGRRNQKYFKIAQIGVKDKKPLSNLLMSRESFFCPQCQWNASFVKKFEHTVPETQANSIQISVLWKTQSNLFKIGQFAKKEKKQFSNQIVPRELFLSARTATKLLLKVYQSERMSLYSRDLKIQYPRDKLIPLKSPVW